MTDPSAGPRGPEKPIEDTSWAPAGAAVAGVGLPAGAKRAGQTPDTSPSTCEHVLIADASVIRHALSTGKVAVCLPRSLDVTGS